MIDADKEKIAEWLNLARKRVDVPENWIKIKYLDETDLLFIRFLDSIDIRGDYDYEKHTIYFYDAKDRLVSMEILDLYEKFGFEDDDEV